MQHALDFGFFSFYVHIYIIKIIIIKKQNKKKCTIIKREQAIISSYISISRSLFLSLFVLIGVVVIDFENYIFISLYICT
jgi:hypothetical protein